MKSLKQLVLAKSIAAAFVAAGIAGTAISATPAGPIIVGGPIVIDIPGTPDNGMRCLTTPNAYTISLVGTTVFCKRTKVFGQALTCSDPRFPTKVVRVDNTAEDVSTRGLDVCLAPNRSLSSNDLTTGLTLNQDFIFVTVGSTQASTIVTNQRQVEATATGLPLAGVDARSLGSTVSRNLGTGGEDRVQVTVEFATFGNPVGGILVGSR